MPAAIFLIFNCQTPELMKSPRCKFVLYIGSKKVVKRKEFEKFISESVEI